MDAPKTFTELVEIALGDLSKIMLDERYLVNMGAWHMPMDDGKCHACFAGAVIAKSFETKPTEEHSPYDFGEAWSRCLNSLDDIRNGEYYVNDDAPAYVIDYTYSDQDTLAEAAEKFNDDPTQETYNKFAWHVREFAKELDSHGLDPRT